MHPVVGQAIWDELGLRRLAIDTDFRTANDAAHPDFQSDIEQHGNLRNLSWW